MVRPSSFCLGLVHPILVATAMVEAEARTSLEWRPLQPQRRPIATVPLLCTFAWLLPPDSRELALEKGKRMVSDANSKDGSGGLASPCPDFKNI